MRREQRGTMGRSRALWARASGGARWSKAASAALVAALGVGLGVGAGGCGGGWAGSSDAGGGVVETAPPPECPNGAAACAAGLHVEGPPVDGLLSFLFPGPGFAPRFRFGQAAVSFEVRSSQPAAAIVEARVSGGDGQAHALDLGGCAREDLPASALSGAGMTSTFQCAVPVPWVFPGPQRLDVTVALDSAGAPDDAGDVLHVSDEDHADGAPALEVMSVLDAGPAGGGADGGAAGAARVWLGTLHDGLVLAEVPPPTVDGAAGAGLSPVALYPGIDLDQPYDAAYAGPQSNYVTALASEPGSSDGRGLWVGT